MEQLIFKTYTGTKTIKAAPMGAGEAKRYGAQITDETVNRNIGNDGYLVEYPDGYRSWSPKKAFEDAYRASDTFLDYMKIEHADLTDRIGKVNRACLTPGLLKPDDRNILIKQLNSMIEYAQILRERIEKAEIKLSNSQLKTPSNGTMD